MRLVFVTRNRLPVQIWHVGIKSREVPMFSFDNHRAEPITDYLTECGLWHMAEQDVRWPFRFCRRCFRQPSAKVLT